MRICNNGLSVNVPQLHLGFFCSPLSLRLEPHSLAGGGQAGPGILLLSWEAHFILCLSTGLWCLSLARQNESSAVLLVAAEEYDFGRLKEKRECLLQSQRQQSETRSLGFAQWLRRQEAKLLAGERYVQRHFTQLVMLPLAYAVKFEAQWIRNTLSSQFSPTRSTESLLPFFNAFPVCLQRGRALCLQHG